MSGKRPSLADSMRQVVAEPLPVATAAPASTAPRAARPAQTSKVAETAATRPAGFYAATRAGKKKLTASVDPAVHAQLKILAVQRGTTTEALLAEAVTDLLQKLDPAGGK